MGTAAVVDDAGSIARAPRGVASQGGNSRKTIYEEALAV
jgi:hypothetical protein